MEYVVIREFTDKDTKQKYLVGDRYPHKGFANKGRAEELLTGNNKRGKVFIEPKTAEKKADEVVEEIPKKAKSETVKRGKKK